VDIARILQHSEARNDDLRTLLKAQLLFWLLAATDGHAKNFSIFLLAGGRCRLTPFTTCCRPGRSPGRAPITSTTRNSASPWRCGARTPTTGSETSSGGTSTTQPKNAVSGRTWNQSSTKCFPASPALEEVGRNLPPGFPEELFAVVAEGIRTTAARL
jgi:serine/threonine-protein kinase HipA